MRVNELAKELGKTSKEVMEILQKQNQDITTHSANMSDDQVNMVKRAVSGQQAAGTPAAKPAAGKDGEAPKKKIAAVYRPQNSQQRPQRPPMQAGRAQGQAGAGTRGQAAPGALRGAGQGQRPQGQTAAQGQVRPQASTGAAQNPALLYAYPLYHNILLGNRLSVPTLLYVPLTVLQTDLPAHGQ